MVMVELKGLHIVKAKGREYIYAWRGGPRVKGVPGTPEFQKNYNEAVAEHRMPETGRFRSVIIAYKASADYAKLADSTKRMWGRWLERINDHFGELSIKQFDRPEKIRPIIRRWRATYAETPRAADYGMQVLSRVLSYAVDPMAKIASNPCEGIKGLYANNRAEIIWLPSDIAQLRAKASAEVMRAVDLAAHTGLRPADLVRLAWSHIGDDAIVIATSKSRFKKEAIIPLYDDLRKLLASTPKRSTQVLTNTRGKPWTGITSSFSTAMERAGMADRDLHFYDLRGTAATKFYLAGLSERVIAEIMGWEEDHVAKIIRRYVDRKAALKDAIRQLNEAKR